MSDVTEVERARLRALVDRDIELARRFHHPEFQLITPRGIALSLSEYLAEIQSGVIRYLRWVPEAMQVRQTPLSAVIRYRAEIEMMANGTRLPVFRTWHADAYERYEGRWAVTWSQATRIE